MNRQLIKKVVYIYFNIGIIVTLINFVQQLSTLISLPGLINNFFDSISPLTRLLSIIWFPFSRLFGDMLVIPIGPYTSNALAGLIMIFLVIIWITILIKSSFILKKWLNNSLNSYESLNILKTISKLTGILLVVAIIVAILQEFSLILPDLKSIMNEPISLVAVLLSNFPVNFTLVYLLVISITKIFSLQLKLKKESDLTI